MSYVLGIDVSSHAIDLVRLDETTNHAEWGRIPLQGATSFQRLRQIPQLMPDPAVYDDCYLAAIERPKTRFMPSAAALFPVFGAVTACLPAALEVWDVSPSDWRKGLGLKGNATKETCAARVRDLMLDTLPDIQRSDHRRKAMTWPQDAFDAYAVAYYARELNSRGVAIDEAREKQLVIV